MYTMRNVRGPLEVRIYDLSNCVHCRLFKTTAPNGDSEQMERDVKNMVRMVVVNSRNHPGMFRGPGKTHECTMAGPRI